VQIKDAAVDYSGNCGNMSSAIGPFAVDEGLVPTPPDGEACIRIHNTNTRKIIQARFPVRNGRSVEDGDLTIPGVHGSGAPVRLEFLQPGGASTGRLLPSGRATDLLELAGSASVPASLVDAANACVFVAASSLGLTGTELPDEIAAHPTALEHLRQLRLRGSVAMGITPNLELAAAKPMIPLIAIVSAPASSRTLDGELIPEDAADLVVRMISNGQPHRALPLTGSLCTAVAMEIAGTIPNTLARRQRDPQALRLSMPSGVLTLAAEVAQDNGAWHARSGCFYRTTRRLFDGFLYA
jgi:2-methylaconitate cis-trans-isomerase PrpF